MQIRGNPHKTPIDKKRLIELHEQGLRNKDIAIALGCSYNTVARNKKKLGLEKVDVPTLNALYAAGWTDEQIADELHVTEATVRRNVEKYQMKRRKVRRRPWEFTRNEDY